jgi:hypothetical protein
MSSVQATLARRGDLRGLAAVACPVPATQAWLLGGGAGQGRRSRLLLTNPAPAPATVDVAVHGRTGRRAGPAARGVTLPAGGTRALLLDALAPGVDPVAVHVVARSGRFVATLHDTVLRGLVPGGTDGVGPAAPAATTQVVPGVTQGEGRVVVRILVPGGGDAVVRVGLLGTAGRIPPAREVVTVRAGTVADVPVRGIPAGSYAAVVEADVPVVAGVLVERATERAAGPADVAWASSAEPLTANVLSAVPTPALAAALAEAGDRAGPRARPAAVLVLSAPQAGRTVVVGEYAATGKRLRATRLRLPAHRTVRLGLLPTAGAVLVSAGDVPDAPLYGALELSSADPRGALLAVVPLRPPAAPPREVRALREDRRAGVP